MSPPNATNARADGDRPPSPAADRTLTVLETLVESEKPLTLTALARTANIPLASTATIMQTLEGRGYATRRVVGRSHFWTPTLRLSRLGSHLLSKLDLTAIAQPYLRALSDSTKMPAHVGLLDGAEIVYVARATTSSFVQFNTYVGKSAPFNLTALGKAIAAYLPDSELNELASRMSRGRGPRSMPGGVKALLKQLAEVRERGYAVEDEEEEAGIACIAAPILDVRLRVLGSVGVAGFRSDVIEDRFDAIVAAVTDAATRISRSVGAPVPASR